MADAGDSPPEEAPEPPIPDDVATELPEDADVVTVSELSAELEQLVETTDAVHHDYILGDISGPSTSSNDHLYFTLEGDDAQLQCVVFASRRSRLTDDPTDEMQALVEGDLEYYAQRGQMSLQVTDVTELGEGSYSQVYRETKQALEEEGLLADDQKQPLPRLPTRIGIVTSKHGDAVDDAIQAIHDRYPGIDIRIAHATVQGDDAVESIVANVARLDEDPSIDLVVVTRGGGADATLRTFNELAVCHAIARTDTPIAVGIGHENDETLAGMVADERIITPTDAGQLVPDRTTLEQRAETLSERLDTAYTSLATDRIETRTERLQSAYERTVVSSLRDYEHRLQSAVEQTFQTRLSALTADLEQAFTSRKQRIEHQQEVRTVRRRYTAIIVALLLIVLAVLAVTFVL